MQRQAGTGALRQHALSRVLLEQRRRPQLQRRLWIGAAELIRRGIAKTVQRQTDVHDTAFNHVQAAQANQVVSGETFVEQIGRQLQGVVGQRFVALADQDLVGLHGQGAATRYTVATQLAIEAQVRLAGRRYRAGFQRQITALAAAGLAVGEDRATGRHIEHAAGTDIDIAAAADRHPPTVERGQARAIVRPGTQIAPDAAGIEVNVFGHRHLRRLAGCRREPGVAALGTVELIEHVAQTQAAATRGQVCADLHIRRIQRDVASGINGDRAVNDDLIPGRHLERTETQAVELLVIEKQLALARL